jgi:bacteriorhodopsin
MIYESGVFSLIVQLIVAVIEVIGLQFEVNPNDEIIKDLLKVEFFVQGIEFLFYVWLIMFFYKYGKNITPFRYADWSITTPLMLITLAAYLKHSPKKPQRLLEFLKSEQVPLGVVVILNTAMLLFGYWGETGFMHPYLSTLLGFIPFGLNFKYIYKKFVPKESSENYKQYLYYWFVVFWGLYGVFAVMSYTVKNTGYNILDLFSKNFFGVFLAYIIWQKSNQTQ